VPVGADHRFCLKKLNSSVAERLNLDGQRIFAVFFISATNKVSVKLLKLGNVSIPQWNHLSQHNVLRKISFTL